MDICIYKLIGLLLFLTNNVFISHYVGVVLFIYIHDRKIKLKNENTYRSIVCVNMKKLLQLEKL